MQAAFRDQYCGPGGLTVRETPRPRRGANQVLVRVHATTVNRTDAAVLTGKPFIMRFFTGLFKPKSPVPGTDFAGEVVEKGETAFEIGDKVFGFNDQGLASQAEYMVISEKAAIAQMPAGIDFVTTAASLEAAHYAYNFLSKVKAEKGQRVMVNGATGGIGSALVQFLKHLGLEVTAVCGTQHVERIRSLGATRVIDYQTEDFTKLAEKFDYVFDAVGKSTFKKCKPLLKEKGIYISSELGPYCQNPFLALLTALFPGKKVKFPVPLDIPRSMRFISDLLVQGKFIPLIDRKYPLQQIAEAYAYVMTGQKIGNVVITIA
jgi:NADPH:quinone reductase-like Zn-dependent oxidoreductase